MRWVCRARDGDMGRRRRLGDARPLRRSRPDHQGGIGAECIGGKELLKVLGYFAGLE